MSQEARTSKRYRSLLRSLWKVSYRKLSHIWTTEDPRPLLRRYLSLYGLLAGKEFSDADPFGLIEINPLDVAYVSNRTKGWDSLFGEVVGGDWDRRSVPIDDIPLVSVITAHIQDGEPLDCEAYREYYTRENRRTDPFEVRCLDVENLIWDIAHGGYRSQHDLLMQEDLRALQGRNNDTIHPLLNEIRVDIDRDGTFHHWRCGLHRLSITQALGISTVPVLVGTRHSEWQAVRDQFRQASSVADLPEELKHYVGHPDLQGFIVDADAESNRDEGASGWAFERRPKTPTTEDEPVEERDWQTVVRGPTLTGGTSTVQ